MITASFLRRRLALPILTAAGLLAGTIALTATGADLPAAGAATHAAAFHTTDRYVPTVSISKLGTTFADSQSDNWSGYNQGILDSDTPYSSISGQWVVPTATQHTAGEAEDSATWIGIGGGCLDSTCDATDETLIQAGTEQDISASGAASYDAWYEIIPAPEIESTITVNPGDTIDCLISSTVPGLWSISLKDVTDGQSFSETLPYSSDESTAEWIEETPTEIGTSGTSLAALPNLTTVNFTDATTNGANANLLAAQGVQLIDSNSNVIADPSAPSGGNEFNDCAWATTCAEP
jgi:Peptidase A4 family